MMKQAIVILLMLLPSGVSTHAGDSPVAGLVAAERAFASTSIDKGVKTAFVTWLAEDGIVFRPGPVNGREYFEKLPESDVVLAWEPVFADISAAGDLGYTTGPWTLTRESEGKKSRIHGHYLSVWKKADPDDEGSWRVVLDHGISHPQEGARPSLTTPSLNTAGRASQTIVSAEEAFDKACRKEGPAACYREFMAPDIRLYRDGSLPFVGAGAAAEAAVIHPGTATRKLAGSGVSRSDDIAYSWGTLEIAAPEEKTMFYNFMRIWKVSPEGGWTIVADVVTPYPSAAD